MRRTGMNNKGRRKGLITAILFGIFFLYLYVQHQFVYLYFDDYGYASLSYGYTETHAPMDYSFMNVLRFLKWHYLEWGGRVLYYFFGILSMRAGLWWIRLLQSALILGFSLFSYLLVREGDNRRDNAVIALVLIFSYGAAGIGTFQEGIFWFSAAMGYVWPLCPLFGAVYCQRRYHEDGRYLPAACILFFLAAFSYEQTALLTAVYAVLYYGFAWLRERKYIRGSIPVLAAAFLGSGLEILAPGNFVRAGDEANAVFNGLSVFGKIRVNLPKLLEINIGYENRVAALIFLLSGIFCAALLLSENPEKPWRKYNIGGGIVLAVPVICGWYIPAGRCLYIALILWAAWYTVNMTLLLWGKKDWLLALFYGGLCSQAMMLVSPSVPARCHIPMEFILHIAAAYVTVEFLRRYRNRGVYALLICVMLLSAWNTFTITRGYYRNSDLNKINHRRLLREAEAVRQGAEPGTVALYRMRDDRYASQMPYNQQFIQYWMKLYYALPQETVFQWTAPDGGQ